MGQQSTSLSLQKLEIIIGMFLIPAKIPCAPRKSAHYCSVYIEVLVTESMICMVEDRLYSTIGILLESVYLLD